MLKIIFFCFALAFSHVGTAAEVNTFIAFITGGFDVPRYIAITPNGLYAYVTNGGDNSVRVIDTNPSSPTFNTVVSAPALVGTFDSPNGIAITPNGAFAYVCDSNSNSVLVIDTDPTSPNFNTLVAAPGLIGVFDSPNSIAITPNGLFAYVTNTGDDSVNLIDINPSSGTYNTVIATPALVGVLNNPFDIEITPSGLYAYIANLTGSMNVVDIDPSSPDYNTVLTTPGLNVVNAQPEGFSFTKNGFFAYVTDGSSADVTVVDTNPASPTFNTVLSAPSLIGAFNFPNDAATTTNGLYVYVSNFIGASGDISSVSVIDTNPSSPTYNNTLYTPGLIVPSLTRFVSLAITPDDRYVYVVDTFNNNVGVIFTGIVDAPLNFTGTIITNVFLLNTSIIYRLTWSAPTSGNTPVEYRIYRDANLSQLVATIPATSALEYDIYRNAPWVGNTYYIVTVDALGNTSFPISTTVTECSAIPCILRSASKNNTYCCNR